VRRISYFCSPIVTHKPENINNQYFDGMEEKNDNIAMSCGAFLAISEQMKNMGMDYARVQEQNKLLAESNKEKDAKIAELNAALKQEREEKQNLKMQVERQQQDIDSLKATISNMASTMQQPDKELLQRTIDYLLEEHLLISILNLRNFMTNNVADLETTMALRSLILEFIPETLRAASLPIVMEVTTLPDKPKTPQLPSSTTFDFRNIHFTGEHAIYEENPKPKE